MCSTLTSVSYTHLDVYKRQIWNLPPLPDGQGQAYTIRGEYYLLKGDGTAVQKGDETAGGANE